MVPSTPSAPRSDCTTRRGASPAECSAAAQQPQTQVESPVPHMALCSSYSTSSSAPVASFRLRGGPFAVCTLPDEWCITVTRAAAIDCLLLVSPPRAQSSGTHHGLPARLSHGTRLHLGKKGNANLFEPVVWWWWWWGRVEGRDEVREVVGGWGGKCWCGVWGVCVGRGDGRGRWGRGGVCVLLLLLLCVGCWCWCWCWCVSVGVEWLYYSKRILLDGLTLANFFR